MEYQELLPHVPYLPNYASSIPSAIGTVLNFDKTENLWISQ